MLAAQAQEQAAREREPERERERLAKATSTRRPSALKKIEHKPNMSNGRCLYHVTVSLAPLRVRPRVWDWASIELIKATRVLARFK